MPNHRALGLTGSARAGALLAAGRNAPAVGAS